MGFRDRLRNRIRQLVLGAKFSSLVVFVLYVGVTALAVSSAVDLLNSGSISNLLAGENAATIFTIVACGIMGVLYRYIKESANYIAKILVTRSRMWIKILLLNFMIRLYLIVGAGQGPRPLVTQIGVSQVRRRLIFSFLLILSAMINFIASDDSWVSATTLMMLGVFCGIDGALTRGRIKSGAYGEADYELRELVGFLANRIVRGDDPEGPNKVFPKRRENTVDERAVGVGVGVGAGLR
jgi:hypothetical protein